MAQLVARYLGVVEAVGSSPVTQTKNGDVSDSTDCPVFLYSKLKSHKIGLWSDAFKKGAEIKFL